MSQNLQLPVHSWQRVPNLTLVHTHTYTHTHLPRRLQSSPPLLFLPCFFGRMGDRATFDVLFYLMILLIYTCQTLVPQYQKDLAMCFMQQDVSFTEV